MVKLDENKIKWIIKSKDEKAKNSDIADILKIAPRRVQQVYSQYKKTKKIPALKRPGRPKKANHCSGDRTGQANAEKIPHKCTIP